MKFTLIKAGDVLFDYHSERAGNTKMRRVILRRRGTADSWNDCGGRLARSEDSPDKLRGLNR